MVAAGGYALVAPDGFVADDGLDARPAQGAVIARVAESRLVGSGVPVSGAALAITEPDGRAVSRFSTVGLKLAPGQSARRVVTCDVAGAYQPSPDILIHPTLGAPSEKIAIGSCGFDSVPA